MDTMVVCKKCEKLNRVPLSRASQSTPICGSCQSELPLHDGLQEMSDKSLEKLLKAADRPIIVDFWAPWCGPCRTFAPTFQRAASELGGRMIFGKINADDHPKSAERHQVRGIPTVIVFKGGIEVDRQAGGMTSTEFVQYLAKF